MPEYKTGPHKCTHKGCDRSFPTEAGRKLHETMMHDGGGREVKVRATKRHIVRRKKRKQQGLAGLLEQMTHHIENVKSAMEFFNGGM